MRQPLCYLSIQKLHPYKALKFLNLQLVLFFIKKIIINNQIEYAINIYL